MRRSLSVIVLAACSRSPESTPPVVAVEPAGSGNRIDTTPASSSSVTMATADGTEHGCDGGSVRVIDGSQSSSFVVGRELPNVQRGSKYAHVELVIHPNGQTVLHLEGVAQADGYGGHLSLTMLDFKEPKALPATFEHGYVEYMALGDRNERRMNDPRVEITKWGPEGAWVEGTFGEGSAPPVMSALPLPLPAPSLRPAGSSSARPPVRLIQTVPYRGTFRVCRSKDWNVRH